VICDGKTIYDSESKTLKSFKTSSLSLTPHLLTLEGLSQSLKLAFLTPTRILYNSHLTLDLEFHILIRNLLRRLSLLYYFHCSGDPSDWDFKGIIEKAKEVNSKAKSIKPLFSSASADILERKR
jgi:hypothetical protein